MCVVGATTEWGRTVTTPSGLSRSALQYWGVASGAVADRAGTADVWAAINAHATSMGRDTAGLSLSDFNQLRSAAAGVRNSGEALAAGRAESAITGDMIGTPPWARTLGEQNAQPLFQARFQHTTTDLDGNESTDWRTVTFSGGLPATHGDFMTALGHDAEALADKYGTAHVGIDSITLLGV